MWWSFTKNKIKTTMVYWKVRLEFSIWMMIVGEISTLFLWFFRIVLCIWVVQFIGWLCKTIFILFMMRDVLLMLINSWFFPLIFWPRHTSNFWSLLIFMRCHAISQLFGFFWTAFDFRMISRKLSLLYGKWKSLGFKSLGLGYLELTTLILQWTTLDSHLVNCCCHCTFLLMRYFDIGLLWRWQNNYL